MNNERTSGRRRFSVLWCIAVASCGAPTISVDDLRLAEGERADDHVEAERRLLDDYMPWLGPFSVRGEVRVETAVGWCYAFFATASDGVRDLDMRVLHADGRVAGTDTMFDATPYVQHCADVDEEMRVLLDIARGRGEAMLSVVRKQD